MESTNEYSRDAWSSYPGAYPAGVFIVQSAQHLGPLVSRLRARRMLKAGRNVTVFDAEGFAEVEDSPDSNLVHASEDTAIAAAAAALRSCTGLTSSTKPTTSMPCASEKDAATHVHGEQAASCLVNSFVKLFEMTAKEAEAVAADTEVPASLASRHERCALTTLRSAAAGVPELLNLLRVPRSQRTAVGTSTAAREERPSYMAVHVNGDMSDEELLTYLGAAPVSMNPDAAADTMSPSPQPLLHPPVAFIRGVRRFHRVCCPDLRELPSALAALRQSALFRRCADGKTQRDGRCLPSPPTSAAPRLGLSDARGEGEEMTSSAPSRSAIAQEPAFTFSELFGGIGMFRTALEGVGGRATVAVEFAPPAQIVYALNHRCWHDCPAALQLPNANPAVPEGLLENTVCPSQPPVLVGDIVEIPSAFFPPHDVLTGGFPCQSFAKAGTAAGLNAEKGWLFYEVVRVLAATRPAAFLLENVEHLVEVEAGAQLGEIQRRLQHPGTAQAVRAKGANDTDVASQDTFRAAESDVEYEVRHVVVDGGVLTPQVRRRVYFFGFRKRRDGASCHGGGGPGRDRDLSPRVAETVVADALHRLEAAAATAPYRCVQDLLVVPSVKGIVVPTPTPHTHHEASLASPATDTAGETLQLTAAQWEAVRRSHTFRQNPLWRVCDVAGKARTLLGSYRTSYQLYSEFVPFSTTHTLQEVLNRLTQAGTRAASHPKDGTTQQQQGSSDEDADADAAPPLRFFSIRECARLQGIRDAFRFPHDDSETSDTADLFSEGSKKGAERRTPISSAVLRQVPRGAVYKLIGNAVNPCVVECLCGAIAAYLQEQKTQT
uniref:DNA (cytosine-5-)-methyltransferase n=1 Tax=Crithidia acanthocephali TaxID=59798 RepID=U5KMZ1_9TRYP|nr:DNA (cytosine-5-)-methyltransferase [Crithidia acanthocephali]